MSPRKPIFLAAVLLLSVLLNSKPAEAESALNLAKRFLASYRYQEAFTILRSAAKLNPNDPEIHYLMAQTMDKGHAAGMRRAVREYEIYCQLDPNGSHYTEAQNAIKNWNNALSYFGKAKVFSNLDYQDEQYYKDNEYHSWDEIPEPIGIAKRRLKQNAFLIFDTEFVSPRLTQTSLSAACPTAKWAGDFLHEFNQRWKETASSPGHIEAYFFVNDQSQLIPTIVHFSGTTEFKEQFFKVVHSFDGSPILNEPAKLRTIFKGLIAARYSNGDEGTYCSFKGSERIGTPYMAHVQANIRTGGAQGLQISNSSVQLEALPKIDTEQVKVSPEPLTELEANHLKKAREAIHVGNMQQAIDYAWPAAEKDDLSACLLLADLYKNPYISLVWLEKASQLGDPDAQYKVAHAYEWGNGTLRGDITDGISWLRVGAAKGESNCLCELGILYEMGDGVPQDLKIAKAWYFQAANETDAAEGLKRVNSILVNGAGAPYIGSLTDAISQVQANLNNGGNTSNKPSLKQPIYLKELAGYKLQFFKNLRVEPGKDTVSISDGKVFLGSIEPPKEHIVKIKLRTAAGPGGKTISNRTCWTIGLIHGSIILVNDPDIEYLELYTPAMPDAVYNFTLALGSMVQLQGPSGELLMSPAILSAANNPAINPPASWTQPVPVENKTPNYELCTNYVCLHDFPVELSAECLKEIPLSRGYSLWAGDVYHLIKFPYPNWHYWTEGVAEALTDIWQLQRTVPNPGKVVTLGRNYLSAAGKVNYTHWQEGDTIIDTNVAPGWPQGKADIRLTIKSDGNIKAEIIDSDFSSAINKNILRSIKQLSKHPAIIFPNEFPASLTAEDISFICKKQQIYGGINELPFFDSVSFICTIRPN